MHITPNEITTDRQLSALDIFAVAFSEIIQRHTPYVIVSGYVSILLGRSRVSEDIDMILPFMDEHAWKRIYDDLVKTSITVSTQRTLMTRMLILKTISLSDLHRTTV